VAVLGKDFIAQTMDGCYTQLRKVTSISNFVRGRGQPIAHLERRFLSESAQYDFLGFGALEQNQVEGAKDDTVRLTRSGSSDYEKGTVHMRNDCTLRIVQIRKVFENRRRNGHSTAS